MFKNRSKVWVNLKHFILVKKELGQGRGLSIELKEPLIYASDFPQYFLCLALRRKLSILSRNSGLTLCMKVDGQNSNILVFRLK